MTLMAALSFRRGTAADEAALWALRTRCVRDLCCSHYPAQVIARWSASGPPPGYVDLIAQGNCVVAEDDQGTLLGYGIIDRPLNEVDALFVEPDRAGQGIGLALLQEVLLLADPARDIVLSASLNAVDFYLRAGFIDEGAQDYPHPSGIALASVRMRRRVSSP